MDPTAITIIVAVAVALVVVGLVALLARRKETEAQRRHLQERFGPEYHRAVADADDRRQAEARLSETEHRRDELDVRPLSTASRDRRIAQWESVQVMFVDAPVEATDAAGRLVDDVMTERGYPDEDDRDRLAVLAADHAETVESYRAAEALRHRFHTGEGSTEDLRRAFVEYRRLFDVLVHEGVGGTPEGPHDGLREGPDDRRGDQVADRTGAARSENGTGERSEHRAGERSEDGTGARADEGTDRPAVDRSGEKPGEEITTVDLRDDRHRAGSRHLADSDRTAPRDER